MYRKCVCFSGGSGSCWLLIQEECRWTAKSARSGRGSGVCPQLRWSQHGWQPCCAGITVYPLEVKGASDQVWIGFRLSAGMSLTVFFSSYWSQNSEVLKFKSNFRFFRVYRGCGIHHWQQRMLMWVAPAGAARCNFYMIWFHFLYLKPSAVYKREDCGFSFFWRNETQFTPERDAGGAQQTSI